MNVKEMLNQLLLVICTGALGVITTYVSAYFNAKKQEVVQRVEDQRKAKIINDVIDVINKAVTTTTQTYTDSIKSKNNFLSEDEQKEAFNRTVSEVKAQLTIDSQKVIEDLYGNYDVWIKNQIESIIGSNKLVDSNKVTN